VRVLGLMMVRNAEGVLRETLDAMAEYCDGVCVVVDRSSDGTEDIGRRHPLVRDCSVIPPGEDDRPWAVGEDRLLTMLYGMAEREGADWLLRLDCDERVEPGGELRSALATVAPDVAGVRFPKWSTWDDPDHPDLVPLMGSGRTMNGAVWRACPGLRATRPLHNPRLPAGVETRGAITDRDDVIFLHTGWSTLAKRVRRVEDYMALDPECRWNYGVPYDEGLLFGYRLDELDELVADYRRMAASPEAASTRPS
jgi:glycosyltransferase involved in cell wall biosynthesis